MPISFEEISAEVAPERGEAPAAPAAERAPAPPLADEVREQIEQERRLTALRSARLEAD